MTEKPSPLAEPIEIVKFWKNRRRGESIHVTLSEYEGHALINVRVYATGADGIDRPTPKGVAMGIRKLPELAAGITKAMAKARELGLIDDDASADEAGRATQDA
ncbi:hypothetical protein KMZ68_13850 [Bradyrhizobium sediminis]|uniref:Transcriptional coactivator p15 (PC4) C-terminal domain-containing protein n=1 Tax=Bradyrhizobium sediminis TaxID=2840469 RepID=A0A975NJ56_9BRAD|nr:PC4/YdbC family ssDNA-binding protein [Bradyrhizobium sediminis]QWG16128.1 hypothetical protein KMZ68_13850 [Bradyrhizobium sediminis]